MPNSPDVSLPPEDPRVRFAAERTLLAWIRTSVALMGLGFVVARFGVFLREIAAAHQGAASPGDSPTGWSLGLGTALIALGVVISLLSATTYRRYLGPPGSGGSEGRRIWSMAVVVAVLLAVLGAVMIGYLLATSF